MSLNRAFLVLALAALLAASVSYVVAETEPDTSASAIEEHVEVTAPAPPAEDIAAFATVLDLEQASRRGEDLGEVLKQVPGARVLDYGGLGSFATVSLRASTAEQVTVLVDGVPQNRALGGPVDLSTVPLTQVESVTVFRGFAPAALSLGGIGGLIDVRTREPGREPELSVDLLAGQLGTARASGSASTRAGGGRLRIGVEALESDGDFEFYDDHGTPFNADDDAYAKRVNGDVEQGALFLRETWDAVAHGELSIGVRAEKRDRGVPGKGNMQSPTARLDDTLFDLGGSWRRGFAGFVDSAELMFDAFSQDTEYRPGDDPTGVQRDRDTHLAGGGLNALVRSTIGRNAVLLRGELRDESARVHETFGASGKSERRSLALTFEDVVVAGRFTLAPSVRLEHWSNGGLEPGTTIDDEAWSGKLGVAYRATPHVGVRGSLGRYQRNPSLFELYGDSGEVTGNATLEPERGDAAELGCEWRDTRGRIGWRAELVGFAREVDDLIWLVQVSQGQRTPFNMSRAEISGVEATASLHGIADLSFNATATWTHSEDVSDLYSSGYPLAYQPEWVAWGGVGWGRGRFEARWETTYIGENSTDQSDTPELRVPERILHDLYASWMLPHGMRAGIDVRNVFDRAVRDVAAYPLPDRTVFVHVGWQSEAAR